MARNKIFFADKKGLGIGQVFVFIVAAITFAFIMIFGYRAISGFLQSGEEVAFVQFKTGLESSIKKLYTEYGSVRVETFTTPAKYRQICFVDMDADKEDKEIEELCALDQVACSVWKDAQEIRTDENGKQMAGYDVVDENVFLKPSAPVKIKVYKISINQQQGTGFLCVPIKQGSFSVVLEGKGDRTELSCPEGKSCSEPSG